MTPAPGILDSLPLEIVFKIVDLLDTNGVKGLLTLAPWLRRHAILVTDHDEKPVLFDIEGVERAYLPYTQEELGLADAVVFDIHRYRQSIRLFEFTVAKDEALDFLAFGGKVNKNFNSTSFIYILQRLYMYTDEYPITRLIDQYAPRAKWRRDHSSLHADYTKRYPEECSNFAPLKSLYVQCVQDFGGMDLSTVTDLHISISQEGSDERPLIHDLKLTNIRNLKIEYTGEIPRFSNIDLKDLVPRDDGWPSKHWDRSLMITNVRFSDGSNSFYNDTRVEKSRTWNFDDLAELVSKFSCFSATGVPDVCLKQCGYSKIVKFIWNKSFVDHGEEEIEQWCLKLPKASALDVTVSASNTRLPKLLVNEEYLGLRGLCLSILAADVSVRDLLRSATLSNLERFHLFRSLSLLNRRTPTGEVLSYEVMSIDEWINWAGEALVHVRDLTIIGASFPLLFTKLAGRPTRVDLMNATLMPVIGNAEDHVFDSKGNLCVDGLAHIDNSPSPNIHLVPVIISEKWKSNKNEVRTLKLDIHFDLRQMPLSEYFKLSTEPGEFENFQLQDESLPKTVSIIMEERGKSTELSQLPEGLRPEGLFRNKNILRHCWLADFGSGLNDFDYGKEYIRYAPLLRLESNTSKSQYLHSIFCPKYRGEFCITRYI